MTHLTVGLNVGSWELLWNVEGRDRAEDEGIMLIDHGGLRVKLSTEAVLVPVT